VSPREAAAAQAGSLLAGSLDFDRNVKPTGVCPVCLGRFLGSDRDKRVSAARHCVSDRLESASDPAGKRHELTVIERKNIGETIRASKPITDDDKQLEQTCVLAVGIEIKERNAKTQRFPVERVCERVTRDPGLDQCRLYVCSLGLIDRVSENTRLVEDESAKAGRCARKRGPGGFDFSWIHDTEATRTDCLLQGGA
jgi:hypothetical protein